MFFTWYLWAVILLVPVSLIVAKVWAVLSPLNLLRISCSSVRHFPDLPYMVKIYPISLLSGPWLAGMLSAVFLSEAYFHFLALTLYPNLFCHLHLCPDLSFYFCIVFRSFWLASLSLQVSSLVTIKDLRVTPRLLGIACQEVQQLCQLLPC